MVDNALQYKCTECGGNVRFNVDSQKTVCDYCGKEFTEDYFEGVSENSSDEKINWKDHVVDRQFETIDNQCNFTCTSCGAEILADMNTVATECVYCGSPVVLSNKVTGMLKPDLILPFRIKKNEVEAKLESFCKKKILLAKGFSEKSRISKVAGMYVPFWLFTTKGDGDMKFDAKKIRTWRRGDYKYTQTKYYDVYREGSLQFEKLPVDASKKMKDCFMDKIEPYEYKDLKEFSLEYMAGYFADKFDVDVHESEKRAYLRVKNTTEDEMKKTVTGYNVVSINNSNIEMKNTKVQYALLPVWILNAEFEGEKFEIVMNGQTGKIAAVLPVNKKRRAILFVTILVLSYIVFAFIAYNLI